jgi:hypothetical protein
MILPSQVWTTVTESGNIRVAADPKLFGFDISGLDYCGGEWKYPRSCSPEAKSCDYVARWEYNENTDKMNFTITTNSPNKWTGIGFSDTPSMSLTDAIIGKLFPLKPPVFICRY